MFKISIYPLILLISCLLILLSCEKEEPDPFSDLPPKTPGRYLGAITMVHRSNPDDTLKYSELEYNEKRYLTRINIFTYEPQKIGLSYRFSYNESGRISLIEKYDAEDDRVSSETMTYKNDTLLYKELYHLSSGIWKFGSKTKIVFNENGQPLRRYWLYRDEDEEADLDTVQVPFSWYYYNTAGNMWAFEEPVIFNEPIFFDYDSKVNPFREVGFDIFHGGYLPWKEYIGYVPYNNMVEYQYGFNSRNVYYFEFSYDGDYPVHTFQNSADWYFHYVDL